jgi:ribosomal protein L44E
MEAEKIDKTYCVKCRKHTDTTEVTRAVTKNNKNILKGICTVCGSKKNRFVNKNFNVDAK